MTALATRRLLDRSDDARAARRGPLLAAEAAMLDARR
jgi:hypothetical protein